MSVFLEAAVARLRLIGDTTGCGLTDREQQVLAMCCDGMESKQIAGRLRVATSTVNTIRSAIMDKLGVKTPAQMGRIAHQRGLV